MQPVCMLTRLGLWLKAPVMSQEPETRGWEISQVEAPATEQGVLDLSWACGWGHLRGGLWVSELEQPLIQHLSVQGGGRSCRRDERKYGCVHTPPPFPLSSLQHHRGALCGPEFLRPWGKNSNCATTNCQVGEGKG